MKDFIRIAHLSDLHFSTNSRKKSHYRSVEVILPKLDPDLIVVTGDIANNFDLKEGDFLDSLREAKEYLESLCINCKIPLKDSLFVVPGNHDYRFGGILGGLIDKIIFRRCYPTVFEKYFGEYFKSKIRPDLNLAVFCFDSNSTKYEVNIGTGEILKQQFNNFNKKNDEFKTQYPNDYPKMKKIALLHHHPMPIFRAEIKKDMREEPFLILKNSATFMREVIKNDINLILHGHKHHRGISKVSFPITKKDFDTVGVISSGSIGKKTDEEEYSFNIIDYYHNGRVYVDYQVQRGEGTFESEQPTPIELFSHSEARYSRYRRLKKNAKYIVDNVISIEKISSESGDWIIDNICTNVTANVTPCNSIPIKIKSSAGLYPEKHKFKIINPPGKHSTWVEKKTGQKGIKEGEVTFDFSIDNTPITYEYFDEVRNAVSFVSEERGAIIQSGLVFNSSSADPSEERLFRHFGDKSPKHFFWHLKFPENFIPINPRIRVSNVEGKPDYIEQDYCTKYFKYFEESNTIMFHVDYPMIDREYSIVWNIRSESESYDNFPYYLHKVNQIKNYFLSLKPTDSLNGEVNLFLKNIYAHMIKLKKIVDFGIDSSEDPFEISISIFDQKINKLRYVAFFCPKCSNPIDSSIWNWNTVIGHPITGLAYKRKQAEITADSAGPNTALTSVLRKPNCENRRNSFFKSFAAIPVFYPFEDFKPLIGIIEMATCSDSDFLFKINDDKDGKKEEKRQTLAATCNILFKDFITNFKDGMFKI